MGAAAVPIAVALTATAASTAFQVSESKRARKAAQREANRQEEEQKDIEREIKKETEEADLDKNVTAVRGRRRALATAKPRRRDTILTSPLGLTNEPETAGKTLLGR